MSGLDGRETALLPLTPAVFHIMLALADGERHGYAIMQEVERLSGGQTVLGPGTLYRSLQKMIRDEFISETQQRGDPTLDDERRRYYQLTEFGRAIAGAEARRLDGLVNLAKSRRLLIKETVRIRKSSKT